MKSLLLAIFSLLGGVALAQSESLTQVFKSVVLSANQWAAIKADQKDLLNGIVVKPGQNIKIDLDKRGEIINLKIFDDPSMSQSKVDNRGF